MSHARAACDFGWFLPGPAVGEPKSKEYFENKILKQGQNHVAGREHIQSDTVSLGPRTHASKEVCINVGMSHRSSQVNHERSCTCDGLNLSAGTLPVALCMQSPHIQQFFRFRFSCMDMYAHEPPSLCPSALRPLNFPCGTCTEVVTPYTVTVTIVTII